MDGRLLIIKIHMIIRMTNLKKQKSELESLISQLETAEEEDCESCKI